MQESCLILIDLQYDFLPGGQLAVTRGDEVLPVAIDLLEKFDFSIMTQDWHPANHGSFASQHPGKNPGEFIDLNGIEQILWPDHCIQNSDGAKFHETLPLERVTRVFPKGQNPGVDSYSGFFDNGRKIATGLAEYLQDKNVKRVYVLGLALDYCVKFTALDACDLGFDTYLVEDGCRAVNLNANDGNQALIEMKERGIRIISSTEL